MTRTDVSVFIASKVAKTKNYNASRTFITAIVLALLIGAVASAGRAQSHEATKPNPAIPESKVKSRANDLLKQMTLDEKIAQLAQLPGFPVPQFEPNSDGLKPSSESSSSAAPVRCSWVSDPKDIDRFQHIAVEISRLHIPILFGLDVIHGYHTIFPSPIATASSWDPAMVEQGQTIAAKEARAIGIDWTFAPMVDIARDARWGRMIEGAGEDPYLGSAIARAQVLGFQGREWGSPDHVLATAKHFAGYGAADGGRDYDASYVPEELMWNLYLPPFKAALDAGVATFMSAYMDLNDIPATGNRWLLHRRFALCVGLQRLRRERCERRRQPYRSWLRARSAGRRAKSFLGRLEHGHGQRHLSQMARARGESRPHQEKEIDDAVRPILEAKIRMGLFEHPYADLAKMNQVLNSPESRPAARRAAQRSIVLLRNEGRSAPTR